MRRSRMEGICKPFKTAMIVQGQILKLPWRTFRHGAPVWRDRKGSSALDFLGLTGCLPLAITPASSMGMEIACYGQQTDQRSLFRRSPCYDRLLHSSIRSAAHPGARIRPHTSPRVRSRAPACSETSASCFHGRRF